MWTGTGHVRFLRVLRRYLSLRPLAPSDGHMMDWHEGNNDDHNVLESGDEVVDIR